MKVKLFFVSLYADTSSIEEEINQWLQENRDISIEHIRQSFAFDPPIAGSPESSEKSSLLISIWYTEK